MKTRKAHYIYGRMIFGFLFIAVITSTGYYMNTLRNKAATCFTASQVASDSRCLYIYSGKVYEKGTKSKPHKSNPCGTDVTSIIPSFHFGNMAKYMDPNYRGDICAVGNPTSTPVPTPAPTSVPTSIPTTIPTATPTISQVATSTPTTSTGNCPLRSKGDADCSFVITVADFEIFRKEFTGVLSTKQADFDSNGVVNMTDFEIFRKGYLGI